MQHVFPVLHRLAQHTQLCDPSIWGFSLLTQRELVKNKHVVTVVSSVLSDTSRHDCLLWSSPVCTFRYKKCTYFCAQFKERGWIKGMSRRTEIQTPLRGISSLHFKTLSAFQTLHRTQFVFLYKSIPASYKKDKEQKNKRQSSWSCDRKQYRRQKTSTLQPTLYLIREAESSDSVW